MADQGFDTEDDLFLRGARVHLNIPPFLRGKSQLSEEELVAMRCTVSLQILVKRAMECVVKFSCFW